MIKVSPDENLRGANFLPPCSCDGCTFSTPCGGFWSGLTITVGSYPTAESLPLLKEQLKLQLAMVEAAEKQLAPQNLQQAEALERKLKEALEEVQHIKAKLTSER